MVFQGLTCLTSSRGQAVVLGLFPLFKTGLLLTWFVVVLIIEVWS